MLILTNCDSVVKIIVVSLNNIYFIRNDVHIQNTIQNVGIRKQEDLYKSVSLIVVKML